MGRITGKRTRSFSNHECRVSLLRYKILMSSQTITDEMRETMARDSAAMLAANELSRLMAQHRLFIAARDFPNWRPTLRTSGDIPGVILSVEIIATDGLLGYFLTAIGETFIGHIQRFTNEIKPMFSVKSKKETKDVRKRSAASKTKKPTRKSILQNL